MGRLLSLVQDHHRQKVLFPLTINLCETNTVQYTMVAETAEGETDEFYDPLDGSGSDIAEVVSVPDDITSPPEIDDPLLGKDGDEGNDWSPHNSFLADSPYFSAFVENDVKSLSILVDTLQDISSRTKTFSKCGALMAEATRRLAFSCRLKRDNDLSDDMTEAEKVAREAKLSKERRRALGNEMADLLELLGEVSSAIDRSLLVQVKLQFFERDMLELSNGAAQEDDSYTETSSRSCFPVGAGRNCSRPNEHGQCL